MQGRPDKQGRQKSENICLQTGDKQLQQAQGNRNHDYQGPNQIDHQAGRRHPDKPEEHRQHEVTGEHVGKQTMTHEHVKAGSKLYLPKILHKWASEEAELIHKKYFHQPQ